MFLVGVSEALATRAPPNTVLCKDSFEKIDSSVTSISLLPNTCNDVNYTVFDISRFTALETLEIGDESFAYVFTFEMRNVNTLKSLKIGHKSFTLNKNGVGTYSSKSFIIENCHSLESIDIDYLSFTDYSGQFVLRNLSSLTTFSIGLLGSRITPDLYMNSYNFHSSSIEIRSIKALLSLT